MLYLIATPIGNIADITIRALEVLEGCECLLCEDTRVTKRLISLLNARGLLKKSSFRYISLHSHNEDSRIAFLGSLLDSPDLQPDSPLDSPSDSPGAAFFAQNVAFLSDAGMPCVSDPGAKLVRFMQENGLPYTILPGASSVLSAFALSGFEARGFRFLGFLPHKEKEKRALLHRIALESGLGGDFCGAESFGKVGDSLGGGGVGDFGALGGGVFGGSYGGSALCGEVFIFFESPRRILDSLTVLNELAPSCEIFVAKELTKRFETHFFGRVCDVLARLKTQNLSGEWVVVVRGGRGAKNAAKNLAADSAGAQDSRDSQVSATADSRADSAGSFGVNLDAKDSRISADFTPQKTLNLSDIYALDLPPKIKAKLLSHLTNKSPKECYERLITRDSHLNSPKMGKKGSRK